MAAHDPRHPRDVPDLALPPSRVASGARAAVPGPTAPATLDAVASPDLEDDFDSVLERGAMVSPTPSPALSGARSGPAPSSGLDVAYRRLTRPTVAAKEPSLAHRLAAWGIPILLFAGTTAALVRLVHRPGGRDVMAILPHAFDASSTGQSGAVAGGALVLAIALGYGGLKLHPRSYAMLASAGALIVTSIAMVTVTLVSTDEYPASPDGALVVPWAVPLAVLLFGFAVAGRGPVLFLAGGLKRLTALLSAVGGGAIVFCAIEISALAARLL